MKTKYRILPLLLLFIWSLAAVTVIAQTNGVMEVGGSPVNIIPSEGDSSSTGLLLLIIPLVVPIVVRAAAYMIPKIPSWTYPIIAPILGAGVDWIGSMVLDASASPILAALLGSAGVGLREIQDQVRHRVTDSDSDVKKRAAISSILTMLVLGMVLVSAPVALTGCAALKPVPVAEGEDPIVVNAERIQQSSLNIYEQTIAWEYANRAILPVEISRAVDRYRSDFPPAWRQSRSILAQYKSNTGVDSTTVQRITAALSSVQSSLLSLMMRNASTGEINQAHAAMSSLLVSIQALAEPSVPPISPVLQIPN